MEESSEAPYDIENLCTPLLTAMSQTQDNDLPLSSDPCCIYRVPEPLRCVNEKAYTPRVVSIGPLHHDNEGLKGMEEHKETYLQYFLQRTKVSREDYVKKIRGKEEELRRCYAHKIEFGIDEFVGIILVDAAFIIELLLRYGHHNEPDINDRIFHKPWLIRSIVPDMLLLENQLPFFILKDLFPTADQLPSAELSVLSLSFEFCKKSTNFYVQDNLECPSSLEVEHFVDLVRTLHLPTLEEASKNRGPLETLAIPSMTKLHRAGVKFEGRSSKNLFDICFTDQDGTLKIPKLMIEDDTELVLRNLVAFEQCHCTLNNYCFSDYILLMDYFVDAQNDVELLVKYGIVENLLGDNNEVSKLINSLGKGVVFDKENFYYGTLTRELNKYYKTPWNKWKADLVQKYFDTPWTTISVIVASFVILLTITQTAWTFTH